MPLFQATSCKTIWRRHPPHHDRVPTGGNLDPTWVEVKSRWKAVSDRSMASHCAALIQSLLIHIVPHVRPDVPSVEFSHFSARLWANKLVGQLGPWRDPTWAVAAAMVHSTGLMLRWDSNVDNTGFAGLNHRTMLVDAFLTIPIITYVVSMLIVLLVLKRQP